MGGDEDELPATQPVLSMLMNGVVAYVEVRSGHDNRSRGVKTQLRNLGAMVVDTLMRDVTHVIFNEGLPSTYKKAKRLKCHLVSVLWIEACKDALEIVPESDYPPIGQQMYEDPNALKNFKKMKSMQPDFEEGKSDVKIGKILKRIQRQSKREVQEESLQEDEAELTKNRNSKRRSIRKRKTQPIALPNHDGAAIRQRKQQRTTAASSRKAPQELTDDRKYQEEQETKNSTRCVSATATRKNQDQDTSSSPSVQICEENPAACQIQDNYSSSSASVQLIEGSPHNSPSQLKHTSKPRMSRNDFVSKLNDFVLCLKREGSDSNSTSPWRRERNKIVNRRETTIESPPPRRSERLSIDQNSPLAHGNFGTNVSKPVTHACISASNAVLRRQRIIPPSPDEDCMLLSQDPNDMPSTEAVLKMGSGADKNKCNAGEEEATFSQIVRSYNNYAKKRSDELKTSSNSNHEDQSLSVGEDESSQCSDLIKDNDVAELDDVEEEEEAMFVRKQSGEELEVSMDTVGSKSNRTVREESGESLDCQTSTNTESTQPESTCPSRAESAVSSISNVTVIIGGEPVTRTWPSVDLMQMSEPQIPPVPETSSCDNSAVSSAFVEEEDDRCPSPVFLISKQKIRRPFKIKPAMSNQVLQRTMSLTHQASSPLIQERKSQSFEGLGKVTDPIQYLNQALQIMKPKLLPTSPANTPKIDPATNSIVLAEDTPDVPCVVNSERNNIVIPPTPIPNADGAAPQDVQVTPASLAFGKPKKFPLFCSTSANSTSTQSNLLLSKRKQKCAIKSSNISGKDKIACEPQLKALPDNASTGNLLGCRSTVEETDTHYEPPNQHQAKTSIKDLNLVDANHAKTSEGDGSSQKPETSFKETTSLIRIKKTLSVQNGEEDVSSPIQEPKSLIRRSPRKSKTAIKKVLEPKSPRSPVSRSRSSFQRNANIYCITQISNNVEMAELLPKQETTVAMPMTELFKRRSKRSSSCKLAESSASTASTESTSSSSAGSHSRAVRKKEVSSGYDTQDSVKSTAVVDESPKLEPSPKRRRTRTHATSAAVIKQRNVLPEVEHSTDKRKLRALSNIAGELFPSPPSAVSGEVKTDFRRMTLRNSGSRLEQARDSLNRVSSLRRCATLNSSCPETTSSPLPMSDHNLSSSSLKLSPRRSSDLARKRLKQEFSRKPKETLRVLVCTFLTSSEQLAVENAVQSLKGCRIEDKVTSRTTHVINSGPKRTINMLKGMVRGCWIINQNWILDSARVGEWLNEREYELTQFSPCVQLCRVGHEEHGKAYRYSLFASVGNIFVSPNTTAPPARDIKELLQLCGGKLSTSVQNAALVIGEDANQHKRGTCSIKAVWVLDCITQNKLLDTTSKAYTIG